MKNFKVALLQILPDEDICKNLNKGLEYCKEAKKMSADIGCFPKCGV